MQGSQDTWTDEGKDADNYITVEKSEIIKNKGLSHDSKLLIVKLEDWKEMP